MYKPDAQKLPPLRAPDIPRSPRTPPASLSPWCPRRANQLHGFIHTYVGLHSGIRPKGHRAVEGQNRQETWQSENWLTNTGHNPDRRRQCETIRHRSSAPGKRLRHASRPNPFKPSHHPADRIGPANTNVTLWAQESPKGSGRTVNTCFPGASHNIRP